MKARSMMRFSNKRTVVLSLVFFIGIAVFAGALVPISHDLTEIGAESPRTSPEKNAIAAAVGQAIQSNQFPREVEMELKGQRQKLSVEYTIDDESQAFVKRLLNLYQPDYGVFVALDARTGRILVMASSSKVEPNYKNLALSSSFPAASIFKVVTASAAIDTERASASTVVPFNGRNHTLYKRNVANFEENRWTRYMTLKEAFARSVNVFFGKLGLYYVGPKSLMEYAQRYQFNQMIKADVPIQVGLTHFSSDDPWSVVSAASGFTRDTTMSPLQGALMAAAVANDGIMMEPFLVEKLFDSNASIKYQAEPRVLSSVVERETAQELRKLFAETVERGTSRKYFRKTLRKSIFDQVEFGGKTGSLTGLNPRGKCDWFVGYGIYKDTKIAVAALTVNQLKWRVKSSNLANEFFVHFLKDDLKIDRLDEKRKAHKQARYRR